MCYEEQSNTSFKTWPFVDPGNLPDGLGSLVTVASRQLPARRFRNQLPSEEYQGHREYGRKGDDLPVPRQVPD